jgi:hypothetical protein
MENISQDSLFKSENTWIKDIPKQDISEYEKNMLKGTKNALELLEEEKTEEEKTEEEIKRDKMKEVITMLKVISLNRMNLNPLYNTTQLSHIKRKEFLDIMNSLVIDYNEGKKDDIQTEFNTVCIEKLFTNNIDYSQFPVYKN